MNFLAICISLAVIDASTIRCGAEEVLILGITCPEMRAPEGLKTRDALERILVGRRVELKRRGRDSQGRTIAKVFADGRDVACQMVRAGICRESEIGGEYEVCRPIPWPPRR
jgi:endonuclease YncB( thermonuclease family)